MTTLTLHPSEIPEGGLEWTCEIQPGELALSPEEARARGGLALTAKAVKAGTTVRVTGRLTGTLLRQCVRCLKEYEDALGLSIAGEYRCDQPPRHQAADVARSSAPPAVDEPDDKEVYVYTGDDIEVGEMLREQVILAMPMQPLCSEACLGLCPVCGQDLNVHRCNCPADSPANPFQVLKRMRTEARGKHR